MSKRTTTTKIKKPTVTKTKKRGTPSTPARRQYPAQFKADAVKLAQAAGASVPDVAARLGISDKTLYAWVRNGGGHGSAHEIHDENVKLRAENKRLRTERDILKKSLGLFAREPS